jgi:hypothetical protein
MKERQIALRFFLYGGAIVLPALAAPGCGQPKSTVTGKVTYNGQPMPGGAVIFHTNNMTNEVSTSINPDGTYTAVNVPTGNATITISPGIPPNMPAGILHKTPEDFKAMASAKLSETAIPGKFQPIPDKYKDPARCQLYYEVKRGSNTFNVDMVP